MTITGTIHAMRIDLDSTTALPDGTPVEVSVRPLAPSFWKNNSVVELAQHLPPAPIKDLSDLSGDWPEDDSLDEFLELVRAIRR